MEPDPPKNLERSGSSKRRISSILKVPRKSAKSSDLEQQENVVERAKPVEKRNSRRVSFAPADDVLLFSKDVKNTSSSPNPFQELQTGPEGPMQNRQVAVTEDGSQQIIGIKNLLNAPLHDHPQREKDDFTQGAFGEKTVMFSQHDAFMDMTHSTSINIVADLPGDNTFQSYDLPTDGDKRVMFPRDPLSTNKTPNNPVSTTGSSISLFTGRNLDPCIEKKKSSASQPCLDLKFEDLLANILKPSGTSATVTKVMPPAGQPSEERNCFLPPIKTQQVNFDNKIEAPTSALMGKSLNTTRKSGDLTAALWPQDSLAMIMTEVQTGLLPRADDDPFQGLFPSQDMYADLDTASSKTVQDMMTPQQQSTNAMALNTTEGKTSMMNTAPQIPNQQSKVRADIKADCNEGTVMFTADEMLMDMTQSHTANFGDHFVGAEVTSAKRCNPELKNMPVSQSSAREPSANTPFTRMTPAAEPSFKDSFNTTGSLSHKTSEVNDDKENQPMNSSRSFGESHKSTIHPRRDIGVDVRQVHLSSIITDTKELPKRFSTQGLRLQSGSRNTVDGTSCQSTERSGAFCKGLETSFKSAFNTKIQTQQVECDAYVDCKEKTIRFTADDACMDFTQCQTVNIGHDLELPSLQHNEYLPASGEKTVRFSADDAAMDETRSHTVKLSHNFNLKAPDLDPLPTCGEKTVRFSADDAAMDETRSHTVKLSNNFSLKAPDLDPLPTCGEKTVRFSADDAAMDETRSHTVKVSHNLNLKAPDLDPLPTCGEKTVRFSADDAAMDETRSHTVKVSHNLNLKAPDLDPLPTCGEKTVRFSADDAAMDETRSHTVKVSHNLNLKAPDLDPLPTCGEKTVRFSADDAAMDETRSHTVNLLGDLNVKAQILEPLSTCREKMMIVTAEDPVLDEMRHHSLKVTTEPPNMHSHQSKDFTPSIGATTLRLLSNCAGTDVTDGKAEDIATNLITKSQVPMLPPTSGKRTVMVLADDATMEVTRSHTGNIATDFAKRSPHQNVDHHPANQEKTFSLDVSTSNLTTNLQINSQYVDLPTCGEKVKTVTVDGTVMDVTRRHTGNIATNFPIMHSDSLPATQWKTASFTTDAGEDITRGNTLNTVTNFPSSSQNIVIPTWEEKQTEPTANDDCMEMTRCLTVNIDKNTATDSSPKHLHSASIQENVACPSVMKEAEDQTCGLPKERSSPARHFDGETSEEEDPHTSFPQETIGPSNFLLPIRTRKPDNNTETEDPKQASAVMERSAYQGMADINASMDLTEAHKSCILGQTSADKTSPIQKSHLQHLKTTEKSLKRRSDGPADSEVEIKKLPDSHEANTAEATRETEQVGLTCPLTQEMESFALEQDPDIVRSQKSRRKSLADLQSKLRRLSHVINAEPDPTDLGSCTAPQFDPVNKSSDKTTLLVEEPEPQIEVDPQDQCLTTSQPPLASVATTPFTVRTSQLVSRLSVGCFQPKLPQRSQTVDVKKVNSTGDPTKTVRALSHLSSFDHDVSDIYDEELGSLEDVSETLITGSPQQIIEQDRSQESEFKDSPLENDVFEAVGAVQNQKRPFPDDENMLNEKRIKASTETVQMSGVAQNDIDGTPPMTTRTIDSSSSHTTSMRGEATFESTSKQSLFESQLEDFTSDLQMKLEDGTITVSEFFKLFNIDFVIHTPRLSVCPGRLMPDSEVTPLDLLKARHVSHPKQMVYEADVQALTEKVDRLKVRMGDLDRPLRSVNAPLWEEMKHSSEKELKSFAVKLKERNNFFRKTSKVQSDEMKEVLYSSLVHANLEEQQKLKGTIQKADEMIKSLDDCLSNLEAELAAVEETDSENKPSLRSLQQEMKKVTETFADNERQVSNLEMQKHQDSSRLTRLKAETERLESHLDMLSQLSEWKLKDRTDELTVFTFLHETMDLQLMYEKSNEKVADCSSERKVARISFEFLLDEEGSQSHTRLVHTLVSQHIKGESAWEEKYPTSQHVPKLLHDVSLVVSRCRLLGEECRRLRMWGSLPFDILNVSCHDSKVGIVFSCLEKFAKFEVVFAISLVNRLYVVQLESFKNKIGSITMEQIEEIVASFTPGKNLLTKIVKNIHETLLT